MGTQNILSNEKNYNQARKQIAICNLSNFQKITVYGPNAVDLINRFSIRDITKISTDSFFTILMKKRKFIEEVHIVKISNLKYVLLYKENKNLLKKLSKAKRLFPMVTVEDSTKSYAYFSFHGNKANEYFASVNSIYLYKTIQQDYTYYTILTSSINKFPVMDHFRSLGFFEISLETRQIFLYNNNVILDLNRVKKGYRLNIYLSLYDCDNYKFKTRIKVLVVKQFEASVNNIIVDGAKIYNNQGKHIGYVHNHFRINNKNNPYVLAIVRKYFCDKVALIKHKKTETIIKEYKLLNN